MSNPTPAGGWPDPSPAPGGQPLPYPPPVVDGQPQPYPPPMVGDVLPPGASPPAPAYPVASYGAPAGPPGFGPVGYPPPYPYLPPPKTNGMAVGAMVVSIISAVGLCFYGFGGLIGIVGALLGHVAKRQIRDRGEGGDGMALAGIIIGWIAFGLGVMIVLVLVLFVWWAIWASSTTSSI